ncbi:MAG: sigma-54-dependent Fis family transcriptional regulator [Rhodothermaceae bacterium]|nr:sigma-54-dependent Fis family transcriptional regulator [Rhodothermaceae bacterium]
MLPDSPPTLPAPASVLVVDDNEDVLTALRLLLKPHVATVHTALSPEALPALLADAASNGSYDAILLDMNFAQDAQTGREGLLWLDRILQHDPEAVVILITAYGDVSLAVEAMKRGATDFVVKPWQNEKLLATLRSAMALRAARREAETLKARQTRLHETLDEPFHDIVGQSPAMQRVFATLDKVAPTDANVLILGENGTGKELIARAVHRRSLRAEALFVSADLGAIPDTLFESELFGHAKGAFTGADTDRPGRFEVAEGGTLFLDEIGNIPLPMQAKLLTALQARQVVRVGEARPRSVDLRLITATNRPLHAMVSEGSFRQDLLYRINTVEIRLPPLRERGEDITRLAHHFLGQYAQKYRREGLAFSEAALRAMQTYAWPGNVRELQHMVERAVILVDDAAIQPHDLAFSSAPEHTAEENGLSMDTLDLEEIERAAIRKALSEYGGNISQAARALGLTRKSLYRRIEKYGL